MDHQVDLTWLNEIDDLSPEQRLKPDAFWPGSHLWKL